MGRGRATGFERRFNFAGNEGRAIGGYGIRNEYSQVVFRLGLAKALVPFVFVFSPSLLIVAKGFTGYDFVVTFTGCVLGITLLAGALSRFFLVEMTRAEQAMCLVGALLMIAPGLAPTLLGIAIASPMVFRHVVARRRQLAGTAPA